jgi:hypothetical protein
LDLVGNRHALNHEQRHFLQRGVFSPLESETRRAKLLAFKDLAANPVALDGYNILITLESALKGRPLLIADDGVVRDISGVSSGHRITDITQQAMNQTAATLQEAQPEKVFVLFLLSMSKSGEIASAFGRLLWEMKVDADCRTERSVEKIMPQLAPIIVTANSAIMDRSQKVFDLAGFIIVEKMKLKIPQLR